jgi:integrase/ribosomal protein L40E
MNTYERTEQAMLQRLPPHAQKLLIAFFNAKRIGVRTRLLYIWAMKSYGQAVSTPLEKTCNQNLTKWYNSVKDKAPGTIFQYTVKLKALYSYMLQQQGLSREEANENARKLFKSAIPLRQLEREAEKTNELRNKILAPEIFQRLLNATDHPRVRAHLVTSAESGCRPEELATARIKDLEFHEQYSLIRVSGKTGERTIPLIQSIPYLRAWLQVHPDRNNPDAPLFAVVRNGEVRFPTAGAIRYTFWRLRRKLGIKERAYPYMLRHTRLTDLAERGIGEYQLKSFAGWTVDSKMARKYVHFSGRTALKAVLEIEGITLPSQAKKRGYIETRICPRCNAVNEADAIYCNKCSLVLDEELLMSKRHKEMQTDELMDQLIQHPIVQQAIKEAVKQLWTQRKIQKTALS